MTDGRADQTGVDSITIFALQVGGGTLALAPMPGAGGDYAGDLEHITSWRPAFVVSLVSGRELAGGGAAEIGAHIQDKGTRWLHLPIPDFGTPDETMLEAWPDVSDSLRRALSGGGRVLVHCRGGCGRSGMVVLRLMIEAGEAPDEALARLRSIRPCAIETKAQMRWAKAAERGAATFMRSGEGT